MSKADELKLDARELQLKMLFDKQQKRIEELEQKLEQTEKDLADYQFNYPSIKELSKENAELKAEKGCETCCKFSDVQLTKAIEIIKGLLELGSVGDGDYTYVEQAEQFLKEINK